MVKLKDVATMNEKVVGDYFKRRGYTIDKLDKNQSHNPESECDWLVQSDEFTLLCEIKTINSVQRGSNSLANFRKGFENPISQFFNRKKYRYLPFRLQFHSHDLLIPDRQKLDEFLVSLGEFLVEIHKNNLSFPDNFLCLDREICLGVFSVWIHRDLLANSPIKVITHTYEGFNLKAVEREIRHANMQLKSSGENYSNAARLVVLAFAGEISIMDELVSVHPRVGADFGEQFWNCIICLLNRYDNLSAVATMGRQEDPHFHICHNSSVRNTSPLNRSVFDDGVSIQFNSADGIPTTPSQPFDLEKAVSTLLERSRELEKNAITVEDYRTLKNK